MKNKKNTTPVVEVVEVVNNETKKLGRPVNASSKRQQRIAELEAKRQAGLCKKGRPTVAGSKRQAVLAARAAKVANGGELKRGRPVNMDSKRQVELRAKMVKQMTDIVELEKGE